MFVSLFSEGDALLRIKGICFVLLLLGGGLAGAAPAATDPLVRAKAVYDKTIAGYVREYESQMLAWPDKCLSVMKAERTRLQKSGDLDGWTVVNKEVERFELERVITDAAIMAAPASFRSILEKCQAKLKSYAVERNKNVVALFRKYAANLESYQEKLTRAGRMDEALAVQAEVERVKQSKAVVSARFVLDMEEAQRPDAAVVQPDADEGETDEGETDEEETDEEETDEVKKAGNTIYPPGTQPPRDKNIVLKRTTLNRTPHMSLGASVTVSAWEASKRSGSSSSSTSYYSSSRSKSSSDSRFLRLMLRTGRTGLVMTDLHVFVQYFSQNVSSSAGSRASKPVAAATRTVTLDRLDQTSRYIDVAPASFDSRSSSYTSTYSSYRSSTRSRSKSGTRYYGAIVTVFSNEGELLFQGASRPQLKEYASSEVPDFEGAAAAEAVKRAQAAYNSASQAYYGNPNDPNLTAIYQSARQAYLSARAKQSALRAAQDQ
jgi:hypothetical protein